MTVLVLVGGRLVIIGHAQGPAGATSVTVRLSALGSSLIDRPGGARLFFRATVRTADGSVRGARARARVQGRAFVVPRPVFFATASSIPHVGESAYLRRLGHRLDGVKSIRCVGFTDARDTASANHELGLRRAAAVCVGLGRALHVPATQSAQISRGETAAHATNRTDRGRQLNRRTEIHVEM